MNITNNKSSQKSSRPPKHPNTGYRASKMPIRRQIEVKQCKENLSNQKLHFNLQSTNDFPLNPQKQRKNSNASTDDDENSPFNQRHLIKSKENQYSQSSYTFENISLDDILCIKLSNNSNNKSYLSKYKTEICVSFSIYGECKFGVSCAYAHGEQELRPKINISDNYKTKLCKQFSETHKCRYGDRCWFIHSRCADNKNVSYSLILLENCNLFYQKQNALSEEDASYLSIVKTKRLPIFQRISSL